MFKRSLIAGDAASWVRALRVLDRGGKLPRRELNFLLDEIVLQQDAEVEAKAATRERLRKPKP
jgi:hypothetical protein